MERNILLATLLSIVTITAWMALTGQCSAPPPKADKPPDAAPVPPGPEGEKPAPGAAPAAPAPGAPANGNGNAPPVPPGPPSPADEGPQALVKEETFAELENGKVRVRLTSLGAGMAAVWVKDAHDEGHTDALVLSVRSDPRFPTGGIDDTSLVPGEGQAPGGGDRRDPPSGPLLRLHWTRDPAREAETPERDVVYTFTAADGRVFTKQWFLAAGDRYEVRLRLSVKAKEGAGGTPQEVRLLAAGGVLPDAPRAMSVTTDAVYGLLSKDGMEEGHTFGFGVTNVAPGGLDADTLRLVGVRNQYYMLAAYSADGLPPLPAVRVWATGAELGAQPAMGQALKAWFEKESGRIADAQHDRVLQQRLQQAVDHTLYAWAGLQLPTGPTAAPVEVAFFAGPLAREVLRDEAYKPLGAMVTYQGAPDWLADILLWIYDRWRFLLGSVGLAVLLMTLTVRGLLMPLSIRNQLGMRRYGRKVQKLKPKVKALQEKYGGNPQKLREQTMLLYREHGIGFPTGCLMMFLQIPIFFALFSGLRAEHSLRGQTFLWMKDLSFPDRLVDLPSWFPLISSLNLLPIILVVLSILQTRSMPKPTDEQQAQQMRMMKWMPIVFAVILYSYTAALALYMVVSSALAIIESRIVRAKDEHDLAHGG